MSEAPFRNPDRDVPSMLILTADYPPLIGGTPRWLGRIARHWPADVTVLTAEGQGLPPDEKVDGASIRRVRFDFPSWAPDTMASTRSYGRLVIQAAGIAKECRPGFVLCCRGLPEGAIARALHALRGIPYACLVHGEEVSACLSSGSLRRLLRFAYGGADLVVANSQNSACLATSAGARPDRCVVVNPGVAAGDAAPAMDASALTARLALSGKVILSVGRLERRKNHVAVVRALPALLTDGHDVTYVIAGDGEERAAIEAAARCLGVAEHVRLLGRVDDEELAALYQLADVHALPGIQVGEMFEGFGMVFLEAAVAGTPSVAGKAGGSSEAVLDGETGMVVDGDSQTEVTQALATLLGDDRLRARLGRAACERVRAEFDWPIVIGNLVRAVCEKIAVKDG